MVVAQAEERGKLLSADSVGTGTKSPKGYEKDEGGIDTQGISQEIRAVVREGVG